MDKINALRNSKGSLGFGPKLMKLKARSQENARKKQDSTIVKDEADPLRGAIRLPENIVFGFAKSNLRGCSIPS